MGVKKKVKKLDPPMLESQRRHSCYLQKRANGPILYPFPLRPLFSGHGNQLFVFSTCPCFAYTQKNVAFYRRLFSFLPVPDLPTVHNSIALSPLLPPLTRTPQLV